MKKTEQNNQLKLKLSLNALFTEIWATERLVCQILLNLVTMEKKWLLTFIKPGISIYLYTVRLIA